MLCRALWLGLLLLMWTTPDRVNAADPKLPAQDGGIPYLRLETGGPMANTTALAFGPDGKQLYAAGYDKIVRVWQRNPKTERLDLEPFAYRVPIGPGSTGVINALAVSPDGEWLAVGGLGLFQTASRTHAAGRIYLYRPPRDAASAMLREQATIYLLNTRTHAVRVLQGHAGEILQLAFAPAAKGKSPLLVSAAREQGRLPGTQAGRVILWDIRNATYLNEKGERIEGRLS